MTTLDLIAAALREDGYVAIIEPDSRTHDHRLFARMAAGKFGVWVVWHPKEPTLRVMDAHPYSYERELGVLELEDPGFFSKLEDLIWNNRR